MTISRTTAAGSAKVRVESTLHHSFWVLLLVVFPVAVSPWAYSTGGFIEDLLLVPKALVLSLTWLTGLAGAFVSFPGHSFLVLPGLVRRAPAAVKVLLLLVAFLIVGGFFVTGDLAVTLLGGPGRLDGVMLQAAWYSIAILAYILARAQVVAPQRVLDWMLLGGAASAAWLVLQVRGVEPLDLFRRGGDLGVLPNGPLGHGAVTSGYLAIVLISYAVYLCLQKRRRLMPLELVALAILAAGIVASGGRTGLVMVAVVWPSFALLMRRRRQVLRSIAGITVLMLAAGVLGYLTRPTEQRQEYVVNLGEVAEGRDGSFNSRLRFWPAAIRGVLEEPLFGSGPVGFNRVFWMNATSEEKMFAVLAHSHEPFEEVRLGSSSLFQVRLVGSEEFSLRTQVVDKAHNYLLDLAVASGLPAAVMLVGLLALGVIAMARASSAVAHGALAAVAAAAVMGLVWFPMLVLDPIVWGLFGLGLGVAHQAKGTVRRSEDRGHDLVGFP